MIKVTRTWNREIKGFDPTATLMLLVALKSEKTMFENLPDTQFQRTFGFSKQLRDVADADIQSFLDKNFEKIFNLTG